MFKTCESLLTSRLEPAAFTKTHRHRACDASSFSRVNPLRRRMNRRPLLESVFLTAVPPRAFFSRASLARRPQDGRRRLDALLAQGRHVVVHLQVARLAHALRPGAVPTGQMREPARVVGRSPFKTVQRIGKDDMAPVFGEGGNLPTRFFELDREMLKREGFDFEKFAKKVRRSSIIQNQLVTSQAMQDTVTSRELFERMPTRPALAEPEVAAHKVRSYEDDSTDWAPSGGRAAAPEQPAQPARRRPVRSTRNRDPVYTGQKTIGGAPSKRSAPLVRVGTELRFELIAKPALASHVHGADPRPTPYRCFNRHLAGERAVRVMGNIFAIAQLDMQRDSAPLLPSAVRDVLARRQKKLRLPNGSVVVMTPCAVDASALPRGFRTRRTSARRSR